MYIKVHKVVKHVKIMQCSACHALKDFYYKIKHVNNNVIKATMH